MAHAAEILDKTIIPQYTLYNRGRWAVHLKHSLQFLGRCGLKYRAELNEIDLGYHFKKEARGNGFATEAACASIQYGFQTLGLATYNRQSGTRKYWLMEGLEKCGMA